MSPLKELIYHSEFEEIPCVHFAYFPGAINCLKFLQVFICSSDLYSEFYYQLSQVCQQIQSLTIRFKAIFSNGLKDLIYLQNNLEFLTLTHSDGWTNATDISPLFTKHSNNLTKLEIRGDFPLMFISIFTNLQELILSPFGDRKDLQYVIIPQLKTFRFSYGFPEPEYLSKFLENNGGNLEELYLNASEDSLNSTIAKFCPKLKLLFTIFMEDELETLKGILNGCKLLESLKVWCGERYLKEEQLLEIVSKYSPKNFYELKIFYICNVGKELYPKELESFFINWMNRTPQQLLSFVIIKGYNSSNSLMDNRGNLEVVEKYRSLGIFRKFRAVTFEED
ncbi:5572_t:CDS:1 [Funneliformis mosseae]|uniref:5572_t:CDS:1 n=1 Tax=Funneliformis mosseae TaxID=27381 RepID=A0A9N9CJJ9_FUNMO|nr:5572_t:CDS:1 [Funneliformis mosseae]